MKKLSIIASLFFISSIAFAQNPKVVNAFMFLNNGQLDKAKENIDAAVVHAQTANQAKTWLYKGNVYLAIALSKEEKFQKLHATPLDEAYDAYQKSIEIDAEYIMPNAHPPSAKLGLLIIGEQYYNKGVESYNLKDYKGALNEFEKTKKINNIFGVKDSLATYNAVLCAMQLEDNDKSITYLRELISLNFDNSVIYSFLAQLYVSDATSPKIRVTCLPEGVNVSYSYKGNISQQTVSSGNWSKTFNLADTSEISVTAQAKEKNANLKIELLYMGKVIDVVSSTGDYVSVVFSDFSNKTFEKDQAYIDANYKRALQVVRGGKTKYPNDLDIIIAETNIYLATGDIENAQKTLEAAIAQDPNNALLYFTVGSNYDQMSRAEELTDEQRLQYINEAEKAYLKAIEIKADFFDAYYNMGALFFNEGVRLFEIADAITDMKEYGKYKVQFDAMWSKALPYLESAHELDPQDMSTLVSLRILYARLSMSDKHKEVLDKIKVIQGE